MHTGHFPVLPPDPHPAYRPGDWSRQELDPDTPRLGRRQWILGVGCLLVGAAVPTGIGIAARSSPAHRSSPPDQASVDRAGAGLPGWVREMLRAPEHLLLERAGEYEMKSCQHAGDRRCAVGFERLLELTRRSRHPGRGIAAACAVRSLARLDRIDLVETWYAAMSGDPAFADALRAAREELDEADLIRRSRGR